MSMAIYSRAQKCCQIIDIIDKILTMRLYRAPDEVGGILFISITST